MSMMHVVKDLPSHFRFYPAGTSVSIAGYTLSDLYDFNENELSELDLINYYAKGIKTEGIKLEDLFFNDFKFLIIHRKLLTSTTGNFVVETPCDAGDCKGVMTAKCSLSSLSFADFEFNALPAVFSFDWDGGSVEVEMSPLTLGDHITLVKKGLDNSFSSRLAMTIRNFDFNKSVDLVNNCNAPDFVNNVEFLSGLFDFRVEPVSVTCGVCKHKRMVNILDTQVLLRTLSRGKAVIGDGISFGKSGASTFR